MMKKIRPLLLVLALLLALPAKTLAAGSVDTSRKGSLSLACHFGSQPMEGVPVWLYRICAVLPSGQLSPQPTYAAYADRLTKGGSDDEMWRQLALELQEKVLAEGIEPACKTQTDENGAAGVNNLELGLYLVLGTHTQGDGYLYTTDPVFLMLPELDRGSNTWSYSVSALLKPAQSPILEDLEVVKKWKDSCHVSQRPKSVTVTLLCDGEAWGDPVELNTDNDWRYTWHDLDVNHTWTVTEEKVKGYADPEITREGNTFLVTNTCSKPHSNNPWLPQTGQLWWPVPVLIAAGLACLVIGLLRRRKR